MTQILSRDTALSALRDMRRFYLDAEKLYSKYGIEISGDLGRRNVLLSSAQEKFFGRALEGAGYSVDIDGRSGQSDISLRLPDGSLREIECKLTTRNATGSIILQTDYATLQKKGTLDYLYVVAGAAFTDFAVLYFEGLTAANFRVPSQGSRGKAAMLKHTCFDRCSVPVGGYHKVNSRQIQVLEAKLEALSPGAPKKRAALENSLRYWHNNPGKFELILETVEISTE